MAKTKTPFFSMGAQGSVGGSITAQKSASSTLLRGKPLPTDPYSLPQAYQRWLYQDYAYLWPQQSTATRQTYATAGTRYHLTGFQYWMRVMLRTMPDIAGLWHLDAEDQIICYDHSPNNNNGTVIGASPATGLIDGALYFDGINDIVSIPNSSTLIDVDGDMTLEMLIKPELDHTSIIISHGLRNVNGWLMFIWANGELRFDRFTTTGVKSVTVPAGTMVADTFQHLLFRKLGTVGSIWVEGTDKTLATHDLTPYITPTVNLFIGKGSLAGYRLDAVLDNVIFYHRALDETEITRHSLRRYPPE